MRVRHIRLKNWKNFQCVDVPLGDRVFLVGHNASGKSNFLDALRFLRNLVLPGGGIVQACLIREGLSRIRCLAARSKPDIGIYVEIDTNDKTTWSYELLFCRDPTDGDFPLLTKEVVRRDGVEKLMRPDIDDKRDERGK